MKKYLILLLFTLCSCSIFSSKEINLLNEDYLSFTKDDYLNYISSLGSAYRLSQGKKVKKITHYNQRYLKKEYNHFVSQNEILLNQKINPVFFLVEDEIPFHFSLPNGEIYFSTGLVRKYIKTEQLLFAVLARETIQLHTGLYRKEINVPTGIVSTAKLISFTRLPLELKSEINKWSFIIMKRSGHDPSAYLIWLQLQNKNTLDFMLQHGDSSKISREEFRFKRFLAEKSKKDLSKLEIRSSKKFYSLLSEFKAF